MPTILNTAITRYLRTYRPAQGTANGYRTTVTNWSEWGNGVALVKLGRKEVRSFLDWVYDDAASRAGTNPGRTANKARKRLRAVLAWAWDQFSLFRHSQDAPATTLGRAICSRSKSPLRPPRSNGVQSDHDLAPVERISLANRQRRRTLPMLPTTIR